MRRKLACLMMLIAERLHPPLLSELVFEVSNGLRPPTPTRPALMTDIIKADAGIAAKLRTAWVRVQRAKKGGKPDLQAIWDAINLMPEAIAALDRHDEFERDLEAEKAEASLAEQERLIVGFARHWFKDHPEDRSFIEALERGEYRKTGGEQ